MEGKKKFEKPELQVVEMKPAGIMSGSGCIATPCGGCNENWDD